MSVEKRQQSRQKTDNAVKVKVITDATLKDNNFLCRISDLSNTGLRLYGDAPLEVGMTLGLLVELKDKPRKYTLNGVVQWVTGTTQNEYIAGIQLIESPVSDYEVWQEFFPVEVS